MRFQERIYVQTNLECLRNKDILNVNCSSDMAIWSNPTFEITGVTGNTCVTETIEFSGINYTDILLSATSACTISASCLDNVIWTLVVDEDDTIVYSGSFWTGTSLTTDVPTDVQLINALETAFTTLQYDYYNNETTFYVTRPYGVDILSVDTCLAINYSSPCTGSCSDYCITLASQSYYSLTSGYTGVYIIDSATTIDIGFEFDSLSVFTGNTNAIFKYEIYKYGDNSGMFLRPPIYKDGDFDYTDFILKTGVTDTYFILKTGVTDTYLLQQSIPVDNLRLDGDYLVKGYFKFNVTTDFRSRLGDTIDTSIRRSSNNYAFYDRTVDGYFTVNYAAATPYFEGHDIASGLGFLVVKSEMVTTASTQYLIGSNVGSGLIVALNGLTLARNLDYTYSGSVNDSGFSYTSISLLAPTVSGDVLTFAYVARGGNTNSLSVDTIYVTSPIVSGTTNGQGTNDIYYNTDTGKYEIYTSILPISGNDIYVTINGATLANGLDYYQSITNHKRIILIGDVIEDDVINIYYNGMATFSDGIYGANKTIYWYINRPPQKPNGYFTLEISTGSTFDIISQSATVEYITGMLAYNTTTVFSGDVGTKLYYRVRNTKEYETMCGDIIRSEAFSETVPVIIKTNSINSY